MSSILTFLQKRLTEHSSWYGIMLIALSFGLKISPEQQQAIIYFGMAMAGAPDVNLANVIRGISGKNAVTETQQATVAKPQTIKEAVKADENKSIDDLIDESTHL